ncbi:hypothetical protein C8F01DRAFT_981321 [Mycena amicta]|nr:hypothetical protein C8F01DRAFT_981321 [Mycena amicta]
MASSSTAEKNAEFAKLFDLFEMLATRRSRKTPLTEADLDDTQTIPNYQRLSTFMGFGFPDELESVFRKLSNIVPPRAGPATRARRNTVAAPGHQVDNDGDSEGEQEMAKFPLGRTHAFTFRKMIHHLYQVDEWASKVRDVLQRSKLEYKSLADRQLEEPSRETTPDAPGRVHFKTEVQIGGRGKKTVPLVLQGRRRAHSIGGSSRRWPTSPTSPTPKNANTVTPVVARISGDDTRAVKKRCIGRRKSVTGPAPCGEGWFYDAAVSSAERVEPPLSDILNRPRPRYQSLQSHHTAETKRRNAPLPRRRIVSSAIKPEVASTKRRFSEF